MTTYRQSIAQECDYKHERDNRHDDGDHDLARMLGDVNRDDSRWDERDAAGKRRAVEIHTQHSNVGHERGDIGDANELHDAKRDEHERDDEHRDTQSREHAMTPGLLEGEQIGIIAIIGEHRRVDGMWIVLMIRIARRPARAWSFPIIVVILHASCLTMHDGLLAT